MDSQLELLEMLIVFRANSPPYPAGLGEGAITGLLKKHDMQIEKSCLMHLVTFSEGENKCREEHTPVDTIYVDLQKTFEKTSCQTLLNVRISYNSVEVSVRRNMAETHLLNCPQKFSLSFKKLSFK